MIFSKTVERKHKWPEFKDIFSIFDTWFINEPFLRHAVAASALVRQKDIDSYMYFVRKTFFLANFLASSILRTTDYKSATLLSDYRKTLLEDHFSI